MSARKLILPGIAAALTGACLFIWFSGHDDSAIQAQITALVKQYDNAVYLEGDYKAAKSAANQIIELASQCDDREDVEVRGLIRLSYLEIVFGKWGNKWGKNLKRCETQVSEAPTIARGEFLLYSGAIKGKWQGRFDKALERIQEAIWIASELQDDRTLALAYMNLSELHGFKDQANLVMDNTYRGATIAKHYGERSIKVRTFRNLIDDLIGMGRFSEAADFGEELRIILPDSKDAMHADFLAGRTDDFSKYVQANIDKFENRGTNGFVPNRVDISRHSKLLRRMGWAHLLRNELSECRKYALLARPFGKSAGDRSSETDCEYMLNVAQLELADDADKIDQLVATFEEGQAFPYEVLAIAYAKAGALEKSIQWKQRAFENLEKRHRDEIGFLRQSSELFWDSELRSRNQTELNEKMLAQSNFLSTILTVGLTVFGLLGCFYFLLLRERRSLEDTVKTRTMSLSKAMQDVSAADREKSDFLAKINHEIRNPLTAILGYCDLLSASDGQPREYIAGIEASSLHMRELVDKILEVSRIESNDLEPKIVEFFPEQTVNDINDIMAEQATQKNLKYECVFKGDHKSLILSDETKIRQIATNLIGNAIKFTDQGSVQVTVELKEKDALSNSELTIAVKDTGVGIAEQEIGTLFERFTKASQDATRAGSGLGLFITKELVNCLNGQLNLDSKLGKGTQVNVSLPVTVKIRSDAVEVTSHVDQERIVPKSLLALIDKRVLVVDDEEMIRSTLKLQLSAQGVQCGTTEELEETIELVENWRPELVLLDLRMLKHSGFEVFEQIKQSRNSSVPVYAMTGDATAMVREKCLRLGFAGFIAKPFKIHAILELLQAQKEETPALASTRSKIR